MTTKKTKNKDEQGWPLIESVIRGCDRHLLLYGPPGTGKTTAATRVLEKHYNVTVHTDMPAQELLGHFVPKDGTFVWHDGPAIRAWREGAVLVLNEIDQAAGSILTVLYAILDDQAIAHLTLPTGETVKPKAGFRAVVTTNADPACLPEALGDRIPIRLLVTEPHPDALKALPDDLRGVCERAYESTSRESTSVYSYRRIRAFGELRDSVGAKSAAQAVFGAQSGEFLTAVMLGERPTEPTKDEEEAA